MGMGRDLIPIKLKIKESPRTKSLRKLLIFIVSGVACFVRLMRIGYRQVNTDL